MLNLNQKILTVSSKSDGKFLRKKMADFDFSEFTKKEITALVKNMREIMLKADGVGLAANQIGLNMRMFVAQIQKLDKYGNPRSLSHAEQKFYAIFNPEIVKSSKEKGAMEEGCLSVPGGVFGDVERPEKITIVGFDKNGKKIKIKAWGLLARVFQHEVDHLNGILYIDKAKNIRKVSSES